MNNLKIVAEKRRWIYIIMICYMVLGLAILSYYLIELKIKLNNDIDISDNIIEFIAVMVFCFLLFFPAFILFVFKLKTPNKIIIFDEIAETLILNLRKRKIELRISDIRKIDSWTFRFQSQLLVYPKEGKRILIFGVANMTSVVNRLNEIIAR